MHKLSWFHLSYESSQVVMTWMSSVGLALSGVQRRQVAHLSSRRWSPSGVLCRILYDFQAPLGKNQSRVVSGGAPWKADLEMGICTGERFTGKISRGEREEAGPGRGRGWFAIWSQQSSMLVPRGALKLGWASRLSQTEAWRPDLSTHRDQSLHVGYLGGRAMTLGYCKRA